MANDVTVCKRPSPQWKYRVAEVRFGALVGALKFGQAGLLGGAVLGAVAGICTRRLMDRSTLLLRWIETFGLAGIAAGWVFGSIQEGMSGAVLGSRVGGILGSFNGLTFGPVWCLVARLISSRPQ
jgi:hypothetical protein